jgi:hypothetical protein
MLIPLAKRFSTGLSNGRSNNKSLSGSRRDIICAMFDLHHTNASLESFTAGINVYFDDWWDVHYQNCRRQISVKSEEELLLITAHLRNTQSTQDSICKDLKTKKSSWCDQNDAEITASIVLAARLFLMLSIGEIEFSSPPGQLVHWKTNTVDSALDEAFNQRSSFSSLMRIPQVFTALNLEIIAGIKICWTSNLADHLLLKEDESSVMIFHHATFLKLHQISELSVTLPSSLACSNEMTAISIHQTY